MISKIPAGGLKENEELKGMVSDLEESFKIKEKELTDAFQCSE